MADPTIIDPTDILVRIDTSTICRSDLHILKEMRPRRPLTRRAHRARLYLYAFLAVAKATPDATAGRNMLEHFDEYARGKGILQKRAIREEGLSVYEAAAVYWGGGYDPTTEQITEGPIVIHMPTALAASEALHLAIYAAGKAVDAQRRT